MNSSKRKLYSWKKDLHLKTPNSTLFSQDARFGTKINSMKYALRALVFSGPLSLIASGNIRICKMFTILFFCLKIATFYTCQNNLPYGTFIITLLITCWFNNPDREIKCAKKYPTPWFLNVQILSNNFLL